MTLRLLKKHPTTVLSTILSSALAAGLALGSATSSDAAEPPKSGSQSTLDRFLQRSPERDWEVLKQEARRRREAQDALDQARKGTRPYTPIQPVVNELPEPPQPRSAHREVAQPLHSNIIEASYQNTTSDPRKLKSITTILPYADYLPEGVMRTDIDPQLQKPEEVNLGDEPYTARAMQSTCFQWQASNFYHSPLYFEDPALERYGHSWHPIVQPFASVGRFSTQLVGLPYQMAIDGPCKKMYTLGWYRPGDCAPKQIPQVPWNTKAAAVQAGVVTGAFFAFP